MSWFMVAVAPVARLLGGATELLLRFAGVGEAAQREITEEDLRGLLSEAARTGVLEPGERRMVERIMRLGGPPGGLCMTHRMKVRWLDAAASPEEVLEAVADSPFTRYPVARGDLGEIIGVVRIKEYLAELAAGRRPDLVKLAHDPVYVLESTRVLTLLERFRTRPGMRFAVVVDEYGDVQGVATLNDILEAIVGDIPSAGEAEEPAAVRREDGSWLLDGLLPLDEAHDLLGLPAPDRKRPTGPWPDSSSPGCTPFRPWATPSHTPDGAWRSWTWTAGASTASWRRSGTSPGSEFLPTSGTTPPGP
jgi:putative hemolysin